MVQQRKEGSDETWWSERSDKSSNESKAGQRMTRDEDQKRKQTKQATRKKEKKLF
jgi:hypothetical protein